MTGLVVHKYRLPFMSDLVDTCDVPTRIGAPMHLAIKDGDIYHFVGTGRTVDPSWHHLGTVIDGRYVWHIFSEPSVGSGGQP